MEHVNADLIDNEIFTLTNIFIWCECKRFLIKQHTFVTQMHRIIAIVQIIDAKLQYF